MVRKILEKLDHVNTWAYKRYLLTVFCMKIVQKFQAYSDFCSYPNKPNSCYKLVLGLLHYHFYPLFKLVFVTTDVFVCLQLFRNKRALNCFHLFVKLKLKRKLIIIKKTI